MWNLDLRWAKNPLRPRSLNFTVDLFNVINNNVELQRNRVHRFSRRPQTRAWWFLRPAYLQLNQNLSPRIVRFGVRSGF